MSVPLFPTGRDSSSGDCRCSLTPAERDGVPAPATEPAPPGTALGVLPPEHRRGTSHQARWLWRTLRGAELAGLDAGQVLADAIAERDLAGAHDVPSVVDARIRYRLGSLVPIPAGPWSAQVPRIAAPDRRAYVTEIAALMDARKDRIGEHAAEHGLPWVELTGSYHALHETCRQRETVFAAVLADRADRADWDAATRAQRHLTVAADIPTSGSPRFVRPNHSPSPRTSATSSP